jgi:hypothetical protein
MTIDWMQRMKAAGVPADQAEAIASGPDERYVTKDYLDARLSQVEARISQVEVRIEARISQVEARISQVLNDITWRMIGLAVIAVTVVGLLDKLVRP